MKKLGTAVLVSALISVSGFAQTATKKATPTVCPVCKMALSTKKTKDNPTAVKLTKKGKTLYCCAKCTMPASVLVKPKK